jgi:hypothetical protein|tara:strand:- start:4886 stop:5101 length:216 start_codon:yes stop_codon:yes gene_type:complete
MIVSSPFFTLTPPYSSVELNTIADVARSWSPTEIKPALNALLSSVGEGGKERVSHLVYFYDDVERELASSS